MPDLLPGDPVVIDAGIAVRCVVPMGRSDELALMQSWRSRGIHVVAPLLLFAESTSALRRLVHGGLLSQSQGDLALQDLLSLAIDSADPAPMTDSTWLLRKS